MRKRIGSRGFNNYSKSYQKKLLTRLRKEINKNYEALHKKLMLQDNSRDESLFSQSLYDINQTLKVLGKRIDRGTLTYEQAKIFDVNFNIIQTSGYSVFQDRINELVTLEAKMSGVKVANVMEKILNSMSEEELQTFFQSKYYRPVRNIYDSIGLTEYLYDEQHSPQMERLLDFVSQNTNIKLSKKEIRSSLMGTNKQDKYAMQILKYYFDE